jgi:hypothetical protein
MHQVQIRPETTKVLQHYPEIVELTETRKRAISGGRASIEAALKQMAANAQRPNGNIIDYGQKEVAQAGEVSPAMSSLQVQQTMMYQARSAAQAAQNQSTQSQETMKTLT